MSKISSRLYVLMDAPRLLGVTDAKETREGEGREDMREQGEPEAPGSGRQARAGRVPR